MAKEKKQNKKHSPIKVFKNLVFLLKYGVKYAPRYVVLTLVDMAVRTMSQVLGVIFIK